MRLSIGAFTGGILVVEGRSNRESGAQAHAPIGKKLSLRFFPEAGCPITRSLRGLLVQKWTTGSISEQMQKVLSV